MTDLRDCDTKCPFCGKYLHWGQSLDCNGTIVKMLYCSNPECEITEDLLGSEDMWCLIGVYEKVNRLKNVPKYDISKGGENEETQAD